MAVNVLDIDKAVSTAGKKGIRITGTVDRDRSGRFKSFREVFLHPSDTGGVFVLLVQSEVK